MIIYNIISIFYKKATPSGLCRRERFTINLSQLTGFDWDDGNTNKNWTKHGVDYKECEEIFFDENKKINRDKLHSNNEDRYIILGKTVSGRLLYTVFTVRNNKIRIISSRDINKKEIKLYEKTA